MAIAWLPLLCWMRGTDRCAVCLQILLKSHTFVKNCPCSAQLVANPHNCKKKMVGGTLITQGNAMPMADDLQMPLSFLIARCFSPPYNEKPHILTRNSFLTPFAWDRHLAQGNYRKLQDSYREEHVGTIDCSGEDVATDEGEWLSRLSHVPSFTCFAI
jgi:hypothetical protein